MRYLSIFTLLVASSSLASAAFITGTCTATPSAFGTTTVGTYGGGTGTVTYNCAGTGSAVLAGFQIIAGSLTLQADYSFGVANQQNTFSVSIPVAGNTPNPLVASATGFGNSSSQTLGVSTLNGVPLGSGVNVGPFTFTGTGSTTGGVANGNAQLSYSYTVEAVPNPGGVPEPSTLALVGGVLVLAGIRKFRS